MPRVYFFILGLIVLCSCEEKKTKEFDIYKESEMASLMRQMAHINEQLKVRIEKGDDLGEYPANFEKILTASMTKNQEMDDFFKEHAQLFLKTQKQIYAEPENAELYYNLAIDACVKCHETKCPGPLTRIEKLYLK